jgi:hypothetical protein
VAPLTKLVEEIETSVSDILELEEGEVLGRNEVDIDGLD